MEPILEEVRFDSYDNEIVALREKVWNLSEKYVAEKYFKNKFSDGYDQEAYHWIVKSEGTIIASSRLSVHKSISQVPDINYIEEKLIKQLQLPVGSINRLVIDPAWQGHGIGRMMDLARFEKCRSLQCRTVIGITHGRRCHQLMGHGFIRLAYLKAFEDIESVSGEELPSLFYKIL
ncbi:MAG: GNAT family N-acetyltransferase [bacterium]